MSFTRAEAFAPASMGNVGIGFDILGLAYAEPGDRVIAERRAERGAVVVAIEGDGGKLPYDADKNTAAVAANAFLESIGADFGVALSVYKHLPLASGLGGSAASAVAAVVAVNALLDEPLSKPELLAACLEGEAVISGYHADNIAPCLFGGITLIGGTEAAQIRQLPVPENLWLALITPDIAVHTAEARSVLPKQVTMGQMIAQTTGVAQFMDALYRADIPAMAAAMEADSIIEPARAPLMASLAAVREAAKQAGAYGLVISGAGPTLCAVCDSREMAFNTVDKMKLVYDEHEINYIVHATQVTMEGAKILQRS